MLNILHTCSRSTLLIIMCSRYHYPHSTDKEIECQLLQSHLSGKWRGGGRDHSVWPLSLCPSPLHSGKTGLRAASPACRTPSPSHAASAFRGLLGPPRSRPGALGSGPAV